MLFGGIRTLPSEIISVVFEFAIWSDPYVPFKAPLVAVEQADQYVSVDSASTITEYDPQIRTAIGLVSKGWKHIRDMSPRLWTRLDIVYDSSPGCSFESLRWLLARSGSLPLDVRLSSSSSDRSAVEELFAPFGTTNTVQDHHVHLMKSLTRVIAVLQHSIPRWRSLTFGARTRAEAYAALLQFRQPATLLERLNISASHAGHTVSALLPPPRRHQPSLNSNSPTNHTESVMPALFGGKTPSLYSVSLRIFAEPIDVPLMRNLRNIRLIDGWATIDTFANLLRTNSATLEELHIVMVDFRDAFWPLDHNLAGSGDPKDVALSRFDRVVLPSLLVLRLDVPRSTMSCLLSRLSLPSLTSLNLRRTEEAYEEWNVVDDPSAMPDAQNTPSTEDILALLKKMHEGGSLPPLQDFLLSYGSVWESNAGYREQGTDAALISLLRTIGGSLKNLNVQNYSHCESTILAALSDRQNLLCPSLRTLTLTQCDGDDRHPIRRLVEARTSPLSASSSTEGASSVTSCSIDTLSVEARCGHIVCSAEDIRWIQERVSCFSLEQTGGTDTWTRHKNVPLLVDSDDDPAAEGEVGDDDESKYTETDGPLE